MLKTLLLGAMLTSLSPSPSGASDWSVFPGDGAKSANSEHVHDPTIVEIGGKAFCFSTSGDGFTVVRSSSDLRSWNVLGPLLSEQPEWLAKRYKHKSIWAPDVLVLGDRVRVYYSASNFGTNGSVIGLAECAKFNPDRPLEGWIDKGLVIETKPGNDSNAIDAEVIVAPDGKHWMYYGSYWGGIFVVELDPVTGKLKDPTKPNRICVARNTGDRGNPLEGSAVLRRGDDYYLFVSYGLAAQGVRSTYRVMVGRSKSPTGPFLDRDGKSMAEGGHVNVLKTSPPMMSPGHCDVLTLKDGRTVMPYHFYDARRAWFGDNWGLPTLQIRELLWSKDGWPLPGLPLEAQRPPSAASPAGRWLHQADFGQPQEIELQADGNVAGGIAPAKWQQDGDTLTITWTPSRGEPTVDRLQLGYGGGYYVGRNAAGHVVRGIRPDAKEK